MRALLVTGSVVTFSAAGWIIVAGAIPLYVFWLVPLPLLMLAAGEFVPPERELKLLLWMLLFAACTFGGIWNAVDRDRALIGALGWVASLAQWYLTSRSIRTERGFFLLGGAFLAVQSVSALLGMAQFVTGGFQISASAYANQVSGLESMSHAFAKNFLPIAAFVFAWILMRQQDPRSEFLRRQKRAVVWGAMLCLTALAISQSRSAQVAAVLGTVVAGILGRVRPAYVFGVAIGAVVLIFSAVYFGEEKWMRIASSSGLMGDESFVYRWLAWKAGISMALDNPWFGIGMWNFKYEFARYIEGHAYELASIGIQDVSGFVAAEVHNVFIGIAATCGIPAFIIFVGLYLTLLRLAYRDMRNVTIGTAKRYMAGGVFFYLLMFFVSLNMHNFFNENSMWVVIGLYFASRDWRQNPRGHRPNVRFAPSRPMLPFRRA